MPTAGLYIALTFNVKNCILKAENIRIRKTHGDEVTTFVYNTNTRLSQLLVEKKGSTITKYVYGHGLICSYTGNESTLKVYHHDYRGSTTAITNTLAETTDTFDYDTYGKLISRTGTTETPFMYNGRDGVYSDENGLIYMRTRYYSPELRRFINADILHGDITDSTSLNRYAYVNGNPVSFVDPLGLASEEKGGNAEREIAYRTNDYLVVLANLLTTTSGGYSLINDEKELIKILEMLEGKVKFVRTGDYVNIKGDIDVLSDLGISQRRIRVDNIDKFSNIAKQINPSDVFKTNFKSCFDAPGVIFDVVGIVGNTLYETSKYETEEDKRIIATYTIATETATTVASAAASAGTTALVTKICTAAGTAIAPGLGTAIGFVVGFGVGYGLGKLFDWVQDKYIDGIVENN